MDLNKHGINETMRGGARLLLAGSTYIHLTLLRSGKLFQSLGVVVGGLSEDLD